MQTKPPTRSSETHARTAKSRSMQQGPKKRSRSRLAGVLSGHWLPTSSRGAGRKLLRLRVRPARGSTRKRREEEERRVLARSASEPALLICGYGAPEQRLSPPPSPPPPLLERPHTCYDIFSPDSASARPTSIKEAKVVVNVTVEGSPGPVKVMVRLGATIDEAIAAAVERYGREGRSPRLDPASADAFQLHHSHFCLQSLNKNDKIADVGGRSFYLHKNGGSNRLFLRCAAEPGENPSGGSEAGEIHGRRPLAGGVPYHHHHDQYLAIVIKKLDKIGRQTKRIWRVLTCNCT